jgi:hypothetical protein
MTGTQHVGTLKQQCIHYITLKMVLDIFYYQNNCLVFCTSVIRQRHLPAASYNFSSAGVSGNRILFLLRLQSVHRLWLTG